MPKAGVHVVALSELAAAVRARLTDLRRRDGLLPVGLVTGSNRLGLSLVHELGRDGGVLAVRRLNMLDLANHLAPRPPGDPDAPWRADARALAICRRHAAGYFAEVVDRAGFAPAWQSTLADLRQAGLTAADLARRAGDAPRLRHLAELFAADEQARRAENVCDDDDLLLAAGDPRRPLDPANLPFSHLLLAGFYELTYAQQRILERWLTVRPADVFVVRTRVGAPILGQLGHGPAAPAPSCPPPLTVSQALTPAAEARDAVERVWRWCEADHLLLPRCAILFRSPDYLPLVTAALDRLGLAYYTPIARPLAQTRAGKALALLLDLAEQGHRREAVALWELAGPADFDTHQTWAALSADAGIVAGDDWSLLDGQSQRLTRRVAALTERLERSTDDDTAGPPAELGQRLEAAARQLRQVEALRAWCATVLTPLRHWYARSTPGDALARGLAILRPVLERVDGAADLLAELDAAAADPGPEPLAAADAVRLFRRVLERPGPRPGDGAFEQRGVFVADVTRARFLSFDAVVLLGLNERVWPVVGGSDPLLPDSVRRTLGGLPLKGERGVEEQILFDLAVAAARRRLHVSYSQLDLTGDRAAAPSPYLLDLLRRYTQRSTLGFDELATLELIERGSPAGDGPAAARYAFTPADALARRLCALVKAEAPPADWPCTPTLVRLARCERDRWLRPNQLTAYDGLVSARAGLSDLLSRRLGNPLRFSPTSLETYAACPQRFWLSRLLELRPREAVGVATAVEASDVGSLAHDVLKRTYEILRHDGLLPLTPATLRRAEQKLVKVLADALDDWHATATVRAPLIAAALEQKLRRMLTAWMAYEASLDPPPLIEQLEFDLRDLDEAATRIELTSGRHLQLTGRLDRVHRVGPDQRLEVLDYKTGKLDGYRKPEEFNGGRKLQLPLYLLAVAQAHREAADVQVRFTSLRLGHDRARSDASWTASELKARRATLFDLLDGLLDGVCDGAFFRLPSENACRVCDYRDGCGVGLETWASLKAQDPRVVRHDSLAELGKRDGEAQAKGQ